MASPSTRGALEILPLELWQNILKCSTHVPKTLPTNPTDIFQTSSDPTPEEWKEFTGTKYKLLPTCRAFHDALLPDLYTVIHLSNFSQMVYLLCTYQESSAHAHLLQEVTRRLYIRMHDSPLPGIRFPDHISTFTNFLQKLSGKFQSIEHLTIDNPVSFFIKFSGMGYSKLFRTMQVFLGSLPLRTLDVQGDGYYLLSSPTVMSALQTIRASVSHMHVFCRGASLPSLSSAIFEEDDYKSRDDPEEEKYTKFSDFFREHGAKLTKLSVTFAVRLDTLYNLLVTFCPNLRQLVVSSYSLRLAIGNIYTRHGDAASRALCLERIGLETDEMFQLGDDGWTSAFDFAHACFRFTGPQSPKVLRLMTVGSAVDLRSRPAIVNAAAKRLADAGVCVEDSTGEVLPIGQWAKEEVALSSFA